MNKVTMRLATPQDMDAVYAVYRDAIADMNANGIPQWDAIYPNPSILDADLGKGELYVGVTEQGVVAAVVLNEECDAAYQVPSWEGGEPCVIVHRLCVSPQAQGGGVGRGLMGEVENWATVRGYRDIRLDTFSLNPHALRMYDKLGYTKRGEAIWRKGLFYLLEKPIR